LIAAHFFGRQTGFVAAAIALCLPTLVFITAELQTECFATVFTALFLFLLLALEPTDRYAILLGLAAGLAALTRFNAALLPIMGIIVCYWKTRTLRFSLTLCAVTGIVLAPWIIRNAEVFDGKILYSSHGGINLLEGVLTPQGRAQNGEDERVRTGVGWLHSDIETNDAHRLNFPSEDVLDSEARTAAARVWSQLKWQSGVKLLGGKTVAFWLSTDQLFATTSFSRVQRLMRTGGVVAYWIVLVFAAKGWRALYNVNRSAAFIVAFYLLFITLAHLPFVMNTRLRIPFFDPLLATLAAGGLPIAVPINNVLKVHTVESVGDHA
jgi:4-amino-4-deoxy-L-arabinose transferase-like glycosyltransferase